MHRTLAAASSRKDPGYRRLKAAAGRAQPRLQLVPLRLPGPQGPPSASAVAVNVAKRPISPVGRPRRARCTR